MDFITGLPKSKGKSVIMVVVDRITKCAHFRTLTHPFKSSTVSTVFMEKFLVFQKKKLRQLRPWVCYKL